jgi:hypothetical protein
MENRQYCYSYPEPDPSIRCITWDKAIQEYDVFRKVHADLRTEAARVNQELLCYRYLFNELEPTDAIVDECNWTYGVDLSGEEWEKISNGYVSD